MTMMKREPLAILITGGQVPDCVAAHEPPGTFAKGAQTLRPHRSRRNGAEHSAQSEPPLEKLLFAPALPPTQSSARSAA